MRRKLSSVSARFAIAMVVMCLGLGVFASGAYAISGSISGTAYRADGDAAAWDVYVYCFGWDGIDWVPVTSNWVDDDGHYTFNGLADGDYRIRFDPYDDVHLRQYYDGKQLESEADTVTVSGAANLVGIDAHLRLANTISGTVVDAPTAVGLENIRVALYTYDPDISSWIESTNTYTSYDGSYSFTLLEDGTYRVGFDDTAYGLYDPEFWDDSDTVAVADDIIVAGGQVRSDIDASLARQTGTGYGGSISGTVTGCL